MSLDYNRTHYQVGRLGLAVLGTLFSVTPAAQAQITLPIEVLRPAGSMVDVPVPVAPGTSVSALSLTVSGLEYAEEGSVSVDGGLTWIPLDNAHTSAQGLGAAWGGIGG